MGVATQSGMDMKKGIIQVLTKRGEEDSYIVYGMAVHAAKKGQKVVMIFFRSNQYMCEYEKRLEPEIRVFYFTKSQDIANGIHFARKVLSTGECDMLILNGIMDQDNKEETDHCIQTVLENKQENVTVVITGTQPQETIQSFSDKVILIHTLNNTRAELC